MIPSTSARCFDETIEERTLNRSRYFTFVFESVEYNNHQSIFLVDIFHFGFDISVKFFWGFYNSSVML